MLRLKVRQLLLQVLLLAFQRVQVLLTGDVYKRQVHHNMKRTKSKYDARYMLKNPATKKVYTNAQMLADLAQREKVYPGLAPLLEPWIQELTARAQKNPDAEFSLHCSEATEELSLIHI